MKNLLSNIKKSASVNMLLSLGLFLLLSSCIMDQDFVNQSINRFEDQAYKDAIALVELHKLRNGQYPEKISHIEFKGDWDMLNLENVKYQRKDNGYTIIVEGLLLDSVKYPEKFYQGLGIIRE